MKRIFPILLLALFSFSCKQTAEKFYNSGIEKMHQKPESPDGKPTKAAIAAQLRAAMNDFSEAIKMDSNYLKAYEARLEIRKALQDYAGSLADALKLATLEPNSATVFGSIGDAKSNLQDFAGSVEAYGKAISLDPKNADYYYFRADAEEKLDENDAALKDYDQFISIDPNGSESHSIYFARGLLKKKMNDTTGCVIDMQKAKSLGDESAGDDDCKQL